MGSHAERESVKPTRYVWQKLTRKHLGLLLEDIVNLSADDSWIDHGLVTELDKEVQYQDMFSSLTSLTSSIQRSDMTK